jgi:DNA-binding NarL/FixJ family response regulator
MVFFFWLMTKVAGEYIVKDRKNKMSLPERKNRIVVVDDHPVVREGLEQLINREDDLEVCATAGNLKHALEAVEGRQVDLAIIDMLLKNTTGVQLAKKLRFRYPSLYILILSMSDAPHHVKSAFQAGARGYITKDEVSEKIIVAIRRVLDGEIYVDKRIARQCSKKAIASWILETDTKDSLGKT